MERKTFTPRRIVLVASAIAILGSGLAGGAGLRAVRAESPVGPAGLERARVAADVLPVKLKTALAERGFAVETSRRASPDLYLVEREGKQLCYVLLSTSGYSSGCNPKSNFFGNRAMVVGLEQNRRGTERSMTIGGIARPDVASIRVRIGNDTDAVDVGGDGGFTFSKTVTTDAELPSTVNVDAVGRNGRTIQSDAIPTD
jgi:hypothetical protein